ncbi:MAG: acetyl-CoA carboxylase biotin carboxylase subunit, partial [Actinobacteria bacterium]|nr:acetyl-CoA carboxylase biotin carboxylase subunit [Actinomycetota bacterium]
ARVVILNFFFLEMNTRIQVEHPVTEMVTGIDLIKEQIRVASGEPLSFNQEDVQMLGWAIECRVNAEDPERGFRPNPGAVSVFRPPLGPWTRLDTCAFPGYQVSPFFDSMIGKLVVWGRNRNEAIARMRRALDEFAIEGVKTTIPVARALLDDPRFQTGDIHVDFLERWLAEREPKS